MKTRIRLAALVAIFAVGSAFTTKFSGPYTIIGRSGTFTLAEAQAACPEVLNQCAFLTASPSDRAHWLYKN